MNLAALLGPESDLQVTVLTSSRDLGATEPYSGVPEDRWVRWRNCAAVRYCSSTWRRLTAFTGTVRSSPNITVYLNSMFSPAGTLWPLLMMCLSGRSRQVVLAPRGMLKPTAFRSKRWKKLPIIRVLKWLGLTRHITFHATSEAEVREIQEAFGEVRIQLIPNVPRQPQESPGKNNKQAGQLKLCFVGRIHPIKNLLWLLQLSRDLRNQVHLTVVGPVEDGAYHSECQAVVRQLPPHVRVEFVGTRTEAEIQQHLSECDAFVLPTEGENFGHAIFEAFAAGRPVIISDRTIWRNLQNQNAGYDLSISSPNEFHQAIEEMGQMDPASYQELQNGALDLARKFIDENRFSDQYRGLFDLRMSK